MAGRTLARREVPRPGRAALEERLVGEERRSARHGEKQEDGRRWELEERATGRWSREGAVRRAGAGGSFGDGEGARRTRSRTPAMGSGRSGRRSRQAKEAELGMGVSEQRGGELREREEGLGAWAWEMGQGHDPREELGAT